MSDDNQPYQVMPELEGDEYDRLKDDIEANGIEYPIIVDGSGEIIDGHHRYEAWCDLGRDPDEIPTRVVDQSDTDNYHRAYRANLLRRDLTDGTKRQVVKQYLLEHSDRVAEDTQEAIASDLGVGRPTVTRAIDELPEDVKRVQVNELSTEEKREQVREYVEANPEASNRKVSDAVDCDVSHVSVGNWREEWGIEEETTGLDTFTNSKSEANDVLDVVDKAKSSDSSDEVKEYAKEKAAEVTSGDATPKEAKNKVDIEEETEQIEPLNEREPEAETTDKIKVLNLYAGIGGNRRLWGDNVDVTAVEIDSDIANIYRDNFPKDTVVEADAHEYLLEHIEEFDFVWSSPPCPTHSQMEAVNHAQHGYRYPDMSLYQEIILLQSRCERLDLQYCVENVVSYYDPLIEPKKAGRHYYWTNFDFPEVDTPTLFKRGEEGRDDAPDVGSGFNLERHEKVLGFDLSSYDIPQAKKEKALKNCVQPKQGKAIIESLE
jgi:DNA (cytosine-5)-methyltransferase 1